MRKSTPRPPALRIHAGLRAHRAIAQRARAVFPRPPECRVRPADNLAKSTTDRKAALTDSESGKDFASSGSTSTRFDPSAFRRAAYRPRRALEKSKSYSGRKSSPAVFVVLRFLGFIAFSLFGGCHAGADDSDNSISCGMRDDQQSSVRRESVGYEANLVARIVRVWKGCRLLILEGARCRIERDAVFTKIDPCFGGIPFKFHVVILARLVLSLIATPLSHP